MSRATSIYLGMLAVFAAGLWAILSAGSVFLHAPADLAGDWSLEPVETALGKDSAHSMHIEQSGRFFRVSVDGKMHSLRLESERRLDPGPGQEIKLVGQDVEVRMTGSAADGMQLEAPQLLPGVWNAVRTKSANRGYESKGPPTSKPA